MCPVADCAAPPLGCDLVANDTRVWDANGQCCQVHLCGVLSCSSTPAPPVPGAPCDVVSSGCPMPSCAAPPPGCSYVPNATRVWNGMGMCCLARACGDLVCATTARPGTEATTQPLSCPSNCGTVADGGGTCTVSASDGTTICTTCSSTRLLFNGRCVSTLCVVHVFTVIFC